MRLTDEIIIISQTASPKNYCKYEHTMCEFANDIGYCVKTGCSKRIIINEKPTANHNLVEVVRCKDCKYWDPHIKECEGIGKWFGLEDEWSENGFCFKGERKES